MFIFPVKEARPLVITINGPSPSLKQQAYKVLIMSNRSQFAKSSNKTLTFIFIILLYILANCTVLYPTQVIVEIIDFFA